VPTIVPLVLNWILIINGWLEAEALLPLFFLP